MSQDDDGRGELVHVGDIPIDMPRRRPHADGQAPGAPLHQAKEYIDLLSIELEA